MKLARAYLDAAKKAGVKAYYADRSITKIWNKSRHDNEPLMYGGWYWHRAVKGRVTDVDEDGPFSSESAAIRDAIVKLQIKVRWS